MNYYGYLANMRLNQSLSRRKFLGLSAVGLGGLALSPWLSYPKALPEFPNSPRIGRVCAGEQGAHFDLRKYPYSDSETAEMVFRDDVIPWIREVVTTQVNRNVINQRWIETEGGYIYADNVQPVKNEPNQPVNSLPAYEDGTTGAWVEVTVPYVDFTVQNKPAISPWISAALRPRLYYSQIMWADQIRQDADGQVWYRAVEKYGTYGDIFWAPAEAFRLLTEDDIQPIHPEVDNKIIVVDLTYQTLSCMEGNDEVYFCRVSTGGMYDVNGNPTDKWATDLGSHPISRKMISTHMSAGTMETGYDTPGIGWDCLFSNGQAIHSTFWHNGFGVARSHGCVNTLPEDAKWIFRWTTPSVGYQLGDTTISGMNASTRVNVING